MKYEIAAKSLRASGKSAAISLFFVVCLLFVTSCGLYGAWADINTVAVSSYVTGLSIPRSYTQKVFDHCFRQTLQDQSGLAWGSTIKLINNDGSTYSGGGLVPDDQTTFVKTGDIPDMWVRDSSNQTYPYLLMCKNDTTLQRIIRGVIKRNVRHFNSNISSAPFVAAWHGGPDATAATDYTPADNSSVTGYWKLEADIVPYMIRTCYLYWKITGDTTTFVTGTPGDSQAWTGLYSSSAAFNSALQILVSEQNHPGTTYTGMVWCTHRPSDDECWNGTTPGAYNVPDNMFLAAWLPKLAEMYDVLWNDSARKNLCNTLASQITSGINTYATINDPTYGTMWVYEVQSPGTYLKMDDANVPNLLSAPYIGYCDVSNTTYINTRRFVLSSGNPYYFSGSYASGIGSPHTATGNVWPMGIIMQGLTTTSSAELEKCMKYLEAIDNGTYFMHESINVNDPSSYTRPWFTWPDQLYAELITGKLMGLNFIPGSYGNYPGNNDDGKVYLRPMLTSRWQYANMTSSVTFGNVTGINFFEQGIDGSIQSAGIDGVGPVTPDSVNGVQVTNGQTIRIQTSPAFVPSANLGTVHVYPNPYKPADTKFGDTVLGAGIVFAGLTAQAHIRIYTVTGGLVKSLDETTGNGVCVWDTKNKKGSKVASGVYIYLITNPADDSQKANGKFAIIR